MDPAAKKGPLRMLSNGMYVMTSGSDGPATVTWVSQASFHPPLIMAAVRKDRTVLKCMRASRVAAIHILGGDQQDVARKFFSPTKGGGGSDQRRAVPPRQHLGAPILDVAPAYVECQVREIVDGGGDHAVAVTEGVETECRRQIRPLTIAESPWEYDG